jgi:hypothetical protein
MFLALLLFASVMAQPLPTRDAPSEVLPSLSSVWIKEIVDDVENHGFDRAGLGNVLALDSREYPHIVYYTYIDRYAEFYVKHANWTGTGWNIETVECFRHHPRGLSFAIDESGYPHISYAYGQLHIGLSELIYARWNGSAWVIETVESAMDTGQDTSLALDGNGNPHIGYTKVTTSFPQVEYDLRYAHWDGSAWQLEVVEHVPNWVGEVSLRLDSVGHPRMSYSVYVDGNYTLKYAAWNGTAWTIETVDSEGNVGEWNSLAIDSGDSPHIAYSDETNEDLKYASWSETGWRIEIADPGGDTGNGFYGTEPSISLDDSDRPHIGYFGDGTRYAWRNVLGWQSEHVDPVWTGPSISMALNSSGYPRMSYNHRGLGDLRYAMRSELPPEPSRWLSLDIDPDTLNLKSEGRWITAYLSAENASVHDIDISSALLQGTLSPERWDYQDEVLMLKFNRHELIAILEVGESVEIRLSGKWQDGTAFEAYDVIRVIDPGT